MMVQAMRLTRFGVMFASAAALMAMNVERASADPVVKIHGEGLINLGGDAPSTFVLDGNASHLGAFSGHGEVDFRRGASQGSGPVVLRAADGDLLVGIATWHFDEDGNGSIAFSWRDSVRLSDGTLVHATGRFVDKRPSGAVTRIRTTDIKDGTSNIIAILIG